MKRKLRDYLNSKEKNEYNNLDKIFEMYFVQYHINNSYCFYYK